MFANFDLTAIAWSIVSLVFAILALVTAIYGFKRKEWGRIWFTIQTVILFGFCLLGSFSPFIFQKEVTPGIYLCNDGRLHKRNIPQDIPIRLKAGSLKDSGYVFRWWRWKNIEYIDPYDPRVSYRDVILFQTEKEVLLVGGEIVNLPKPVGIVEIKCGTDAFWRKDHGDKPQQKFEMLAVSKNGNKRIEQMLLQ